MSRSLPSIMNVGCSICPPRSMAHSIQNSAYATLLTWVALQTTLHISFRLCPICQKTEQLIHIEMFVHRQMDGSKQQCRRLAQNYDFSNRFALLGFICVCAAQALPNCLGGIFRFR